MDVFLNQIKRELSKEEIIAFVNGMLTCLALMNDNDYTGNTFYFSTIANNHSTYQDAIRKHLSVPGWEAKLEEMADFEKVVEQAIEEFGTDYFYTSAAYHNPEAIDTEKVEELRQKSPIPQIIESIRKALKLLLPQQTKAFTVEVVGEGWYEASYKDFFFDADGEYYYLHLGVSD